MILLCASTKLRTKNVSNDDFLGSIYLHAISVCWRMWGGGGHFRVASRTNGIIVVSKHYLSKISPVSELICVTINQLSSRKGVLSIHPLASIDRGRRLVNVMQPADGLIHLW